jgi:hypothetical protein
MSIASVRLGKTEAQVKVATSAISIDLLMVFDYSPVLLAVNIIAGQKHWTKAPARLI